ncbi:MAG: arginine--tRNA ligase [Deltaproteobacteria bacterium]|nr:arginine--tRNA ligase [Deltaproteobacteria bacterium]
MSSPLAIFRRALAETAARSLGLSEEITQKLEATIRAPEPDRGDLALPCFDAARLGKRKPPEAAETIASALRVDARFTRVEAVGPYVNVSLVPSALAGAIVPAAREPTYGTSERGRGQAVVIDFSSPNIAKPLAFHHVRSTVIGAALGRIHAAHGYKVVGINYLGDWGKQFGILATGFSRHGDPALRSDAKHLVEVYVRANAEADVEARRGAIAMPSEARGLVAELAAARVATKSATEEKEKRKLEKKEKALEKRLRSLRGLGETADPLEGVESFFAELDAKSARARVELVTAEERDREARLYFKRLEEGDEEAIAEWKKFRETSIADFERVYARMGIDFFAYEGESFYNDVLEATVNRVALAPGVRESDGAIVVDMPYAEGEPPAILKTRDGTTLYLTRDVAAAIDRYERFSFAKSLYVVAADQALHFKLLFRTLKAMGFEWADLCRHVEFGRVHGMSTRRGKVVFLDEVLDAAVEKAKEECEKSEKIDREHLEATIEAIGVGAVVFGDLRNLRASDYSFKMEEAVRLDGFSGPYVQFMHARAFSIVKKGGGVPKSADLARLALPEERIVMLALARFPDAMDEALEALEPSVVTRALYDLAQATATWLTAGNHDREKRVLVDDAELRDARLWLVDAVRNTIHIGLAVLGVRAPEAM